MESICIHLVRHGRVASHRGDIPVTEQGLKETRASGLLIRESITRPEQIFFLYTPTVRSRETAITLYETIENDLGPDVDLVDPREEWAIRNPDQFVAGHRVEMVSTPGAMANQIDDDIVTSDLVDGVQYYHNFFRSADRVGFWIQHPDPPGENPGAVARRIYTFCASLLDLPSDVRRRYVCVTHSPVLRAVLVQYLHHDPGEPDWLERIDLELHPDRRTITFREASASLP